LAAKLQKFIMTHH